MKTVLLLVAIMVMLTFYGLIIGGCDDAVTVTTVETLETTVLRTTSATQSTRSDNGPIMPNVDESEAQAVTDVALRAFERDWGDGSGVRAVWGPNIISGWALIGVENTSGAAGKDVLLHQENGGWQVMDMGHALSAQWENQTPPGLWPSL